MKRFQEARGWNQKELAAKMGMKQPQLSRYLTGTNSPTFDILERLSRALKVPVYGLFVDHDLETDVRVSISETRRVLQILETNEELLQKITDLVNSPKP